MAPLQARGGNSALDPVRRRHPRLPAASPRQAMFWPHLAPAAAGPFPVCRESSAGEARAAGGGGVGTDETAPSGVDSGDRMGPSRQHNSPPTLDMTDEVASELAVVGHCII